MASSPRELAAKLNQGGQEIGRANRVGVEKACLAGKKVMLAGLTAAVGGTRIRGVGRKGARVGVRYDVRGTQNPVGIIKYTGPVHLVNNATKAHEITPRKRGGRKALSPAGNPWAAASAQHPGTQGKEFHEKSEPIVLAQAARIVRSEVHGHLARVFTG